MENLARPEVRQLAAYNAGLTIAEVRETYGSARIAKLASNESPFGPSAKVAPAVREALESIRLYPDPAGRALRRALSRSLEIASDRVILGNGSEDLISVICRTVLRPGDRVVTPFPSFQLHEDYSRLMGGVVHRVPLKEGFTIDIAALCTAARGARVLFLSNPMNPTGSCLDDAGLQRLADEAPDDCLLVIDEAYFEYARNFGCANALAVLSSTSRPWIVLRTFSKAYGLAALRVGYGILASPDLRDMMDRVRTPFNVNGIAQVAALAALSDPDHLTMAVAMTIAERDEVGAMLSGRGYRVAPSAGNFVFMDCRTPAGALADYLLRRGVVVKPWKQPGFETFLRVSAGDHADTRQLASAIPIAGAPLE